jgi:hypothetical protein
MIMGLGNFSSMDELGPNSRGLIVRSADKVFTGGAAGAAGTASGTLDLEDLAGAASANVANETEANNTDKRERTRVFMENKRRKLRVAQQTNV